MTVVEELCGCTGSKLMYDPPIAMFPEMTLVPTRVRSRTIVEVGTVEDFLIVKRLPRFVDVGAPEIEGHRGALAAPATYELFKCDLHGPE